MTYIKSTRQRVQYLTPLIKQPVPIELSPAAYDGAIVLGDNDILYKSTGTNWAPIGEGLSAYEVAVENGFVGTVEDWLLSLAGDAANVAVELASQYANNSLNSSELSEYWALESANSASTASQLVSQASNTLVTITNSYNDIVDIAADSSASIVALTVSYVNTQTRAINDMIYYESKIANNELSIADLDSRITDLENP